MSAKETPLRTLQLSAHYYDAAAQNAESDFGNFLSLAEDYYFSGPTRAVAIGRLRREVRNNPYLAGLVNHYPSAIGSSNLRSRTSSKLYNDAKEKFWFRWSRRVTRAGDSLRAVEEVILREMLVAGEVFIVLQANGQIQLVPSEYCGSSTNKENSDGTKEINGIVYDADGRPIGYRFGRLTTAGTLTFSESTIVEARNVIHVFLKDRVHMGRGLPWLLPALRPAHDLYEITRAKTKQIKDANSISGTIESEEPEQLLKGLGKPVDTPEQKETEDSPADPQPASPVVIELKPGTFVSLKPGEKLNRLTTQYQASDYKELVILMLHAISTPVGLPVELWFSGLGDVAYSGFKGLGTQWNARRRYILYFLEDRYLNRLHFWRVSKAKNEGDIAEANPDDDEELIDWAWRRTAVLDEEKEAKANQVRLQSGDCCLADIWEERGLYAEEVFERRRQLWIRLEISAGNLKEGEDHSDVIVPREFLLRGALPGQSPYPFLPAGDGTPEDPPEAGAPSAPPKDKKSSDAPPADAPEEGGEKQN